MDTDACEPYSISIPCVPFFACTMQQEPLSFLFSRLNFCRRVRHWMLDTAKAESLFDLCEKAISKYYVTQVRSKKITDPRNREQ